MVRGFTRPNIKPKLMGTLLRTPQGPFREAQGDKTRRGSAIVRSINQVVVAKMRGCIDHLPPFYAFLKDPNIDRFFFFFFSDRITPLFDVKSCFLSTTSGFPTSDYGRILDRRLNW